MSRHALLPEGEHLRLALRWLAENAPVSSDTIQQASVRFDLSPLEEDFLLQHFLEGGDPGNAGPGG